LKASAAPSLGPIVEAAANGNLPAWAEVRNKRRAHIARVAELLDSWATAISLPKLERDRWVAAGWLHDALRDASPAVLRKEVPAELQTLPDPILHGPAVAERLASDADDELRQAIRYHTVGHPSFGRLGRALFLADFLEPGRDFEREWRESLARRVPDEMDEVLREVLAARISHLLEDRKPIRPETAAFWSSLVERR
jgi:HD superfamily phosphohydrolase YqeK